MTQQISVCVTLGNQRRNPPTLLCGSCQESKEHTLKASTVSLSYGIWIANFID